MPRKINHALILLFLFSLLIFSGQISSAHSIPNGTSYLPIITRQRSGWFGPYGGSIVASAIDPTNPQVLYVGTWGSGVYKSTDGGQSWKSMNSGLGNLMINSLAVDPLTPSTIYAGTYRSQIYKSTNSGGSWTQSGTGMQAQAIVYTIAIDPVSPNILYAGTRGVSNNGAPPWNGVVYQSTDAGHTWAAVLKDVGGADAQDWAYSIAIVPNHPHSIFAATHEHGPYHSDNYGGYWYSTHDGIEDYSGRSILIGPESSNGNEIYYGVWHYDAVYKSLNSGNDWFLANSGIANTKVYSMAIDPLHTNTLYLATFTNGVLKTIDGGETWQPSGLPTDLVYNVTLNPAVPTTLYAGTAGDGLYKSQAGGSNWQAANNGIQNSMSTALITSPYNRNKLYTSSYGAGAYQSWDRGLSWALMNEGLGDKFINSMVSNPADATVLFALTNSGGLYQNKLGSGSGWIAINQGLPMVMVPLPEYPADHPFATREMQEPAGPGDAPSQAEQFTYAPLLSMVFAPSNAQVAYLGTSGSGVLQSTDSGATWHSAGLISDTVQSLAVDPFYPNVVFAATTTPGSIQMSENNGSSWVDIELPMTTLTAYSLVSRPGVRGKLYVGTSSGVYSYDSDKWNLLGLADHQVTTITLDPANPARIYAGTTSGAYYTNDSGLTWAAVDTRLNGISIRSISLDPFDPGDVYISTNTHGNFLATIGF